MKRLNRILSLLLLILITYLPLATKSGVAVKEDSISKRKSANVPIEEWRISPAPANDKEVSVNPPALLWSSEKHWHNKDVLYKVYLSQDIDFPVDKTIVSKTQRFCFYNPHQKLQLGSWHWKYDIIENDIVTSKGVYSFRVGSDAMVFETPSFDEFMNQIPRKHPRIMNQGMDINQIREKAPEHPVYPEIVELGNNLVDDEIYRGPVSGGDLASDRARSRRAGKDVKKYNSLLKAYVLSDNKKILDMLLERTQVLLTWPTDDLLGSQVLVALSQGYDVLFNKLENEVKSNILSVIVKQINHGLVKWPGLVEARHVENHFWQMEVAGNFIAALATVHDLDKSAEMLEYMYELFIARFPNLSTKEDGGWAEGMGYFEVNKSCIVDMALLMKKVGGVDVFKMNWYKNLPDYYNYFAPVDGQVAGFGDNHDRKKNGNMGHSIMLVLGHENSDDKALYRLAQLLKAEKTGQDIDEWSKRKLAEIEPWYQIINDIYFDPDKVPVPQNLKRGKIFKSVGQVAFHTDVLNAENDLAVYFRSSPFGAKGHMHANQNCFNIARKGERLFYSSGYYTTFADPHSLTSYRHTRAHNTILVNQIGQAFGHEGYGHIKRFINGEKISYVCGDASMAYQPMVDQQFLELNAKNEIKQMPEYGFGDAELKLFERHLIFVHPGVIIIYDVLESDVPVDWSFLLHSMKEPELSTDGILHLNTGINVTKAFVTGSHDLKSNLTDQFFSPQIDIKMKYGAIPNHYHTTYKTQNKHKNMRFLSILQFGDVKSILPGIKENGNGSYTIGGIQLSAELDVDKLATISLSSGDDKFYLNNAPEKYSESNSQKKSVLLETVNSKTIITTDTDFDMWNK